MSGRRDSSKDEFSGFSANVTEVELRSAQIAQLYSQVYTGMIAAIVAACALAALLWNSVPRERLLLWTAVFLVVQIPRQFLLHRFHRKQPQGAELLPWGNWFLAGSVTTALLFGISAVLIFPRDSFVHQCILATFLGGFAASTAVAHAPLKECYASSVLLTLLPLLGRFLYQGDESGFVLAAVGLAFAAALLGTGNSLHRMIVTSIRLRYQRDEVIKDLQKAHAVLETRVTEGASELAKTEQRYERLIRATDTGFVEIDFSGRVLKANEPYARMAGASRAHEIIGRFVFDWTAPDALAENEAAIRLCSAQGHISDFETTYLRPDGSMARILIDATTEDRQDGPSIVTLCRDITERKRIETALKESEEMFRLLSEQSLLSVAILQDGVYKYSNQAMSDLCEYSLEEISKWGPEEFLEVVHPDDRTLAMEQARMKQMGDVRQKSNYEFRIITKAGLTKWVEIYSKTVHFEGSPANLLTLVDITKRKNAEEALRESEQHFRELYENLRDGVAGVDERGRIVHSNPQFLRMLGYEFEEVTELTYEDITPTRWHEMESRILREQVDVRGYSDLYEKEYVHKSGNVIPVEIQTYLARENNGKTKGYWALARDITDSKKSEEALEGAFHRLDQIIEFLPDPTLVIDEKGLVEAWNRAMEDLTGIPAESIIGKGDYEYALPFYGERRPILIDLALNWNQSYPEKYISITRGEDGVLTSESYHPMLRGGIFLSGTARVLYDEDGRQVGAIESLRNITDMKMAEKALAESEARFRAVFTQSSVGMVHADRSGCLKEVNAAFATLVGRPAEALQGMAIRDLTHPEDWPPEQSAMRGMLERGESSCRMEKRYLRPDGNEVWADVSVFTVRPTETASVLLIGMTTDITENKRGQLALLASEERLRLAWETSPEYYSISRLNDGLMVDINRGFTELTGYSREEVIGRRASDFNLWFDPSDRFKLVSALTHCGRVRNFETNFRRKDGEIRAVELSAGLMDFDGETHLLAIVKDVEESKKAQEVLRLSELTYREIFNTVNDTIWIHDIETFEFLDVNNMVEEMFGYPVREALNLTLEAISSGVPPFIQDTAAEFLRRAAAGEPQLFEWHTRHKDGHLFWTEVSLKRATIAGKECILAIERDINERKLAEADQKRLQDQLLQAQKMESVGRLAGGVAHDFNNMLSVILGHAELALMRCAPSEAIHARLEGIKESALRSADLVRQLLAFARRQTIAPKVLDVNDTVSGLLKMLLRLIGEDIDLVWMPGSGLWAVKIDPSQIDQILANLCVNARDAIAGVGKVTIETENTSFDDAYCAVHPDFVSGEYVMLAVSDDGCGMSQEDLEHIFEPFFTTKELGIGTGLGLSTLYGIVKQNDGFINVYSEPGKGTTFKVYLPRFMGEATGQTAESTPETPRGLGELVLLVEDEAVILSVGREMLEQLGYKVLTAETPTEALHQARQHAAEIQLLITDVVMPEMNGRDLAKSINDIKPGLKCLFTSGYTANVIAHHGVLEEGVQFIQKPFSLHDLASKVRETLERE
jgi:PAS domain S-box-containing protein